jgi:hypothetical protein
MPIWSAGTFHPIVVPKLWSDNFTPLARPILLSLAYPPDPRQRPTEKPPKPHIYY